MDKPWFAHYPQGIAHEINPDQYDSLIDLVDQQVDACTNSVAFINMGATLTYKQVHDLSTHFAAYLQAAGLKKGSRVAIMMPNLLQYTIAMIGVLRAGMAVVNINPLYTADEVTHNLNDSTAEAIIVVANFAATVEKALASTPTVTTVIITEIGDLLGGFRGRLINFAVKHIKKMVPKFHIPGAVSFKHAMHQGKHVGLQPVTISRDDMAFLQYTGGTTGVPKAAMLSHRNMLANVLQVSSWVGQVIKPDDVVVAALPMYHIFSLTVCCLAFICQGAQCLLVTNPRHMKSFLKILKNSKVSIFVGLNTLFNTLLQQPAFREVDFSNLKLTISGGMALQRSVAERWHDLTGCYINEGYGLTETSPVVTTNPITHTEYSGSIGLPLPSTDITIRDDDNNDLKANETGEICAKGPQIMVGYYNQPEETANVMDSDGWLHTGDIGYMDEKGYVFIVDRKKDMILVSGFNVYPNEIEEVLATHPSILENAVVGVPDVERGECVKAFIVSDDPKLTAGDVRHFCRQHLTRYKIPRLVEFRDELPKSNVGKVLRRALKDETMTTT